MVRSHPLCPRSYRRAPHEIVAAFWAARRIALCPADTRPMLGLVALLVAMVLAACQTAMPLPSPTARHTAAPTTTPGDRGAGERSAEAAALDGAEPCMADERVGPVPDDSGRLPDGLLGTAGGGWGADEHGSFVWRRGALTMTGMGPPVIVPPKVTYEAASSADTLFLTLSQPLTPDSWDLVIFPWAAYE